ncbi:MAG: chemotaxis protein CheX [Clostridium sp.]|nr:chemotaxis protein CheX [Clostridium sp.]MCM1398114.1 chemotaxis protein CheX [Clostridium sp.]MCM1459252.1 chemotaxis protein CheX [Bacteroides sp.]
MMPSIDVKLINPFLQSSISIMESVTSVKLAVGKPEKTDFVFNEPTYAIQVGIVGEMKGQAILAMKDENAKDIASKMMYGMPVAELDEMSSSALNELSNMILGNTATIFSTLGVLIDITPPLAVHGSNLKLKSDIDGIKVPLVYEGKEYIGLYICLHQGK